MINPEKLIESYKAKFPNTGESDSDIYEAYRAQYKDTYDFPDNPYKKLVSDPNAGIGEQPATIADGLSNLFSAPTGPSEESYEAIRKRNEQKGWFAHFKDLNPASWWASADIWGSDFAAKAYNESMAGITYEMMYGAPKFSIKNEDNPWIEEIPQFFVGMMNPIDVMTLGGAGLVGKGTSKVGWKALSKIPMPKSIGQYLDNASDDVIEQVHKHVVDNSRDSITDYADKYITNKVGKEYSVQTGIEGALQMSGNLGSYTTASSFLRNENEQRRQILSGEKSAEDYSIWDSMLPAVKEGAEMAAIGAVTGFTMKGLMLPTHAQAKLLKNPTFADKAKMAMTSGPAQYLTEVAAFTGGHTAFDLMSGEEVSWESFGESLAMNVGIIGGFKIMGKSPIPIVGKGGNPLELKQWKGVLNPFDISVEVKAYNDTVKKVVDQLQYEINPKKKLKEYAQESNISDIADLMKNTDFKKLPKSYQEALVEITQSTIIEKSSDNPQVKEQARKNKKEAMHKLTVEQEAMEFGIKILDKMGDIQAKIDKNGFGSLTQKEKNFLTLFPSVGLSTIKKTLKNWQGNIDGAIEFFAARSKTNVSDLSQSNIDIFKSTIDNFGKKVTDLSTKYNHHTNPDVIKDILKDYSNSFDVKVRGKAGEYYIEVLNNQGIVTHSKEGGKTYKNKSDALKAKQRIQDQIKRDITGKTAEGNQLYVEMKDGKDVLVTHTIDPHGYAQKKSVPSIKETTVEQFLEMQKEGRARVPSKAEIGQLEALNAEKQLNKNRADENSDIKKSIEKADILEEIRGEFQDIKKTLSEQTGIEQQLSLEQIRENLVKEDIIKITQDKENNITDVTINENAIKNLYPESIHNLKELFGRYTGKTSKKKGQLKVDGISYADKLVIANLILGNTRKTKSPKGLKLAVELTKFTRKKYGKGLTDLTKEQIKNLLKLYSKSEAERLYGKEYDILGGKSVKDFKKQGAEGTEPFLLARLANKISDAAKELFLDKFNDRADNLYSQANLSKMLLTLGSRYSSTRTTLKQILFSDGVEAQTKILDYIKTKTKKILGKDIAIIEPLIELVFNKGLRPSEVENIKLKDIDTNGDITITRDKGRAGESKEKYVGDEAQAIGKKILEYAKKNNLEPNDSVFPFEAKSYNKFIEKLSKESGAEIVIYNIATGATSKNLKGAQAGYAIRRQYEGLNLTDIAEKIKTGVPEAYVAKISPGTTKTKKSPGVEGGEAFPKPSPEFMAVVKKRSKLSDKKLKEADIEGAAADFANGVIRVDLKKATIADVFHELYHRFKDIGTVDKSVKRLTEKAESLAKNTKEYKEWKSKEMNKDRNFEEFVADVVGVKAANYYTSKGFISKITQIGKQLMSRVKKFFGVANFNDYTRLIAGRVEKGVIAPKGVKWGQEVRMKKAQELSEADIATFESTKENIKTFYDIAKKDAKANNYPNVEKMFEAIMMEKNIPVSQKLMQTIKDIYNGVLKEKMDKDIEIEYVELVKSFTEGKIPKYNKNLSEILEVQRLEIEKGISEKDSQNILRDIFLVRGGLRSNASEKQLKEYADFLRTKETAPNTNKIETDLFKENPWFVKKMELFGREINLPFKFLNPKRLAEYAHPIVPMHTAVEMLGYKKLAKKLKLHDAIAKEFQAYENTMESDIIRYIGKKTWSSTKDHLSVFEPQQIELFYKWMNDPRLTKKQKKQIDRSFKVFKKIANKEYIDSINKETFKTENIREREIKGDVNSPYKYLQRAGKVTESNPHGYSPEAHVMVKYWRMMDKFWGESSKIGETTGIKKAVMGIEGIKKADYKKIIKAIGSDIPYIKEGFFPRNITQEAISALNPGTGKMLKLREKLIEKYAIEVASKRYKDFDKMDAETQSQMINGTLKGREVKSGLTPIEIARQLAEIDIANSFEHSPSRMSIKHLQRRKVLFDAMQEKDGKLHFTYETEYQKTISPYILNMSTFLANTQVFPEIVKISSLKPVSTDSVLASLEVKGTKRQQAAIEFIKDSFDIVTGRNIESAYMEPLIRPMASYSRYAAKTLLAFPSAGAKNLLVGTAQTLSFLEVRDVATAFSKILNRDVEAWREFEKVGATAQEMKIYEGKPGAEKKYFDVIFKLGLMKPTEDVNRFLSIMGSKVEQQRLIKKLQSSKKGEKVYDKTEKYLKQKYELTDADISFLVKYGESKNITGESFKDLQAKTRMQTIENWMNQQAHIKTQGSTADAYMPKWASSRAIKPFLLFKRMAYHATVNTANNFKLAAKHGNYSKIILSLAASYGSGALLYGLFDKFLYGKGLPDENSPWHIRFKNMMWRGEFLGILSEFMSPYEGSGLGNNAMPAVANHFMMTVGHITKVAEGKEFIMGEKQALDSWLSNSWSAYNAGAKIIRARKSPLKASSDRYSKIINQYEKEELGKGDYTADISVSASRRSPYYRNLKNAFYKGTPEEFAKEYWMTTMLLAHQYMKTNRFTATPSSALKDATQQMERYLKALSPTGAYNFGFAMKQTKRQGEKSYQFAEWLSKQKKGLLIKDGKQILAEMVESEKEFAIRMRKYMGELPYHTRKNNFMGLEIAKYDWSSK